MARTLVKRHHRERGTHVRRRWTFPRTVTVRFAGQHPIDDGRCVVFRFRVTVTTVKGRRSRRACLLGPGQHYVHVVFARDGKTVAEHFLYFVHVGNATQQFAVNVEYLVVDLDPAVPDGKKIKIKNKSLFGLGRLGWIR